MTPNQHMIMIYFIVLIVLFGLSNMIYQGLIFCDIDISYTSFFKKVILRLVFMFTFVYFLLCAPMIWFSFNI